MTKHTKLHERAALDFGVQLFNILNHPQLGNPAVNFSSTSNFGRITAPINTSPIGAGTPRQVQLYLRLAF